MLRDKFIEIFYELFFFLLLWFFHRNPSFVSAVRVLQVSIVRKLMHVRHRHAPTMEFVSIYRKDMREIAINVYVHMVRASNKRELWSFSLMFPFLKPHHNFSTTTAASDITDLCTRKQIGIYALMYACQQVFSQYMKKNIMFSTNKLSG